MEMKSSLLAAGLTMGLFAAAAFAVSPGEHEWLESFDTDRNGLFTAAELDRAAEGIFARADANRDGSVSADEFRSIHRGRGDLDGDANRDGALTLTEFKADVRQHVAAADANRDGQLSMSEIEAMHRR